MRGIEARTLLDSFNTGHGGSLATIHANSATKALRRFANLVVQSHSQTLLADVEAEIGEAVDYVVHLDRQRGRRVVREVLRVEDYNRPAQRFETKLVMTPERMPLRTPASIPFRFSMTGTREQTERISRRHTMRSSERQPSQTPAPCWNSQLTATLWALEDGIGAETLTEQLAGRYGCRCARRIVDIASAWLWFAEGFSASDVCKRCSKRTDERSCRPPNAGPM